MHRLSEMDGHHPSILVVACKDKNPYKREDQCAFPFSFFRANFDCVIIKKKIWQI
jgi:hypothetical protein